MRLTKKSILDRISSGEIHLSTEAQVKSDLGYAKGIEATERWLEETRTLSLGSERLAGRPRNTAVRRVTAVRGLRLETALWVRLEEEAETIGCSVNRFIEESIFRRLNPSSQEIGIVLPSFSNSNSWMWNPEKKKTPSPLSFGSPAEVNSAA